MNKEQSTNTWKPMIPDENTPINTIVYSWDNDMYADHNKGRFFKGIEKEFGRFLVTDKLDSPFGIFTADNAKVDILADLQFRSFLNAPKVYKWFAIDEDGTGKVFLYYPECIPAGRLSAERSGIWVTKREDMSCDSMRPFSICVGRFDQYKHLWKEILIERGD